MKRLCIDGGSEKSAYVIFDGKKIIDKAICENKELCSRMLYLDYDEVVCEMIISYGEMSQGEKTVTRAYAGLSTFITLIWMGHFRQAAWDTNREFKFVTRQKVRGHHGYHYTKQGTADTQVRQRLIKKYGDKGTKNNQGGTYGLAKDMWSAFAIGTMVFEKEANGKTPKEIFYDETLLVKPKKKKVIAT